MTKIKKDYLKLLQKYEVILSGAVIIIFLMILTVKLLIPSLNRGQDIIRETEEMRGKLAVLDKKDRTLNSFDAELFRNNFAKLNYVVPEGKDYVLLFTTLDYLQQRLGIAITRTDFQFGVISTSSALLRKDPSVDIFTLPVNFEVIATADQLQNFLLMLSDLSGRLITVDQVRIELADFGLVKSIINGNAYFNPLPKTIGKIDTPVPEFSQSYNEIFNRILEAQYPLETIEEVQEEVPIGKDNLFL